MNLNNYSARDQKRILRGECYRCRQPIAPTSLTQCRSCLDKQKRRDRQNNYRYRVAPHCTRIAWMMFIQEVAATG